MDAGTMQGLLAAGLGLLCAGCGYFIGRNNGIQAGADSMLAVLAANGIIKLSPTQDGDLKIEAGDDNG